MWGIPPLFSSPPFWVCLKVWTWGHFFFPFFKGSKISYPRGYFTAKGSKTQNPPKKFLELPTKPKKSLNQKLTPKESHAKQPLFINFP